MRGERRSPVNSGWQTKRGKRPRNYEKGGRCTGGERERDRRRDVETRVGASREGKAEDLARGGELESLALADFPRPSAARTPIRLREEAVVAASSNSARSAFETATRQYGLAQNSRGAAPRLTRWGFALQGRDQYRQTDGRIKPDEAGAFRRGGGVGGGGGVGSRGARLRPKRAKATVRGAPEARPSLRQRLSDYRPVVVSSLPRRHQTQPTVPHRPGDNSGGNHHRRARKEADLGRGSRSGWRPLTVTHSLDGRRVRRGASRVRGEDRTTSSIRREGSRGFTEQRGG